MDNKPIFSLDPDQLKRLFSLGAGDPNASEEQSPQADAPGEAKTPPAGVAPSVEVTAPLVGLAQLDGQIGPYKLLRILGEGGMGMVYLAEQQEPIRRKVALKIIKPGMDSQQVIGRFEAERQALALLDHPNVAHVYEAGTTATGRPYFAMEYVKGIPITEYCDKGKLGTHERLKLFIPLCQAIQHAHLKGIIHRDIKPSNALVMLQEERPVPKIIDFGIAKALHQRLTEKTFATEKGELLGTPEYMSPEQAELTGLDVDTRTDIYSLGVLLYELLTGCTPFDPKDLRSKGYAEMQRIICEQDPVKPSTKLTTLGGRVEDIAKHRSATAEQLRKAVCGDLDWIVMKCLEKDRARRYGTAQALAEDIERHLNHQPVSARSPTVRYRTGKYVRRHRRVLAAAGAFAIVLILGTTLSVWEARRAGQAEKQRWALGTALPEIERLLEKDDYTDAFKLVEQARPFIEEDPRFQALSARVVSVISIESTPPGAEVFFRDYRDVNAPWDLIGHTPLEKVRVPRWFYRWRMTLDGYETVEGACMIYVETFVLHKNIRVTLDKKGTLPPGMVRIQGQEFKAGLGFLDSRTLPVLKLSDFLLDRYEVTNRQFKEFVDGGGYQKPEYWKHEFVREAKTVPWEDAIREFVDATGRPGPATWTNGDFPKGEEDYPIGGISWYEAAAYAEYVGKRLPTVYHWSLAAGDTSNVDVSFVVPLSNFGGKGPAPVGAFQGMTSHGVYDMAGNVKEWCFNEAPEGCRVMAGGGWNEPEYTFGEADKYPPLFRPAHFGFRCMKLLTDDGVWEQAGRSIPWRPPPGLGDQKPCSDEVFQEYRRLYDYNKLELQPTIEANEVLSIYTRREKVSFDAAYGNERVIAYLYLPRTGKPPFQTVVYWPGSGAWRIHSIVAYGGSTDRFDYHTKKGRAFVFPVLQGTFERMAPPERQGKTTVLEDGIMCVKDFQRTIDYLETRPDRFDINKLAYEGLSWGGVWGGIVPAIEPRIKVAVLFSGGLYLDLPPACSQVNFAPRIKIPILLQNGKYDSVFPVESHQKPYLGLFGTAQKDKQLRIYETGHSTWLKDELRKDELDFLDKYLGQPTR